MPLTRSSASLDGARPLALMQLRNAEPNNCIAANDWPAIAAISAWRLPTTQQLRTKAIVDIGHSKAGTHEAEQVQYRSLNQA